VQFPNQRASRAFAANQADLLFQSARPFRTRALVVQGKGFPQLKLGRSLASPLQMLLDGGFELDVLHSGL